ncbi:MAG: YggU family protein [Candidatus Methanomethylophilaceae archaeon]|nr:YggU family protein [Candidatus Methanomethylophilaceae archaeon]
MDLTETFREVSDGVEIDISVSPRSDRSGTEGIDEWRKRLTVRVKAPPLDGRANKEVESLFKNITGCKSTVIRGQTSRQKTVLIKGDPEVITKKLSDGLE